MQTNHARRDYSRPMLSPVASWLADAAIIVITALALAGATFTQL